VQIVKEKKMLTADDVKMVICTEREACAQIADSFKDREPDSLDVAEEIALLIRARVQGENG
jgi:hypothetical protein